MYQVITMDGSVEPWWFLEDWRNDIIAVKEFEHYYPALSYYKKEWERLYETLPYFDSKSTIMSAFWDNKEQYWCEECCDYLQRYHSILLLVDWQEIPQKWERPGYTRCSCHKYRNNLLYHRASNND